MTPGKLLFVEFGATDFTHFWQAVRSLPLGKPEVFRQVGRQVGDDVLVEEGLEKAMQYLLQRETVCLAVHTKGSEIIWVQILAPNALENDVSMWHGMLELRSKSHEQVFRLIKEAGVQYVAVAKDDPFDLTDRQLHLDEFPWNSPNFVAAALEDDHGNYVERTAPHVLG